MRVGLALLSVGLLASVSSASYISMNTAVTSRVEGDTLKVLVLSRNKGDEPAYNVQAEIKVAGGTILGNKQEELGVGHAYQFVQEIRIGSNQPGEYPLIVVLHYADANQYPFSALTAKTFAIGPKVVPAEVFGLVRGKTFWKSGDVQLTLKNPGVLDVAGEVRLETPRELTVTGPAKKTTVPAGRETGLQFSLNNFSALSGSNYQLFAVFEYDKDGQHHTVIAPGTVRILERKSILGIDYRYIIAAIVILGGIFLAFQFFKK